MSLFMKVIRGTQKGQVYTLNAGQRIGRNLGEIIIKDEKLSSLHAQIELGEDGQLILVDQGSLNGIKINGEKRERILLTPGVVFSLGNTSLRVLDNAHIASRGWKNVLLDSLLELEGKENLSKNSLQDNIQVINPPLLMTFVRGIQSDVSFLVGYGPRKVGADSLDIELLGEQAPALAFEINPSREGVVIDIKDPSVLFNGRFVSSSHVKRGDFVEIEDTIIEMSFYEGSL